MVYKGQKPPIVPWLLQREYAQHRSIDAGLPLDFRDWRDEQRRKVSRLKRANGRHVVRMVIHPDELAAWSRQTGRRLNEETRTALAEELWSAGVGRARRSTRANNEVITIKDNTEVEQPTR